MSFIRPNTRSLYGRLWQQARPYWKHVAGVLLLSLLAPPLALLTPLPLKIVVDNVLGDRPLPHLLDACLPAAWTHSEGALLVVVVLLLVTATMLAQLRTFASTLLSTYAGEMLLRSLRAQMFRHVQRLSLAYHDAKGTSDTIYRIQNDTLAVQRIVNAVAPFITEAFTIVGMVYVTALINWRLAAVALAVAPVILVVSRNHRRRLRKQSREVKKMESSAVAVVHEVLGASRVVKAFGQEERETQRFLQRSTEAMRARIALLVGARNFNLIAAGITAFGIASLLFVGVHDIQAGRMTLGDLVLIMGYAALLQGPLKSLSKRSGNTQLLLASAERAFALLDEMPDVAERPNARPLIRARGAVEFRNVAFGYDQKQPVLAGVSFAVEPGSCLGIAGPTGVGKTTVLNLLTRFYDPTAGEILLDGVDLRDYKLADLRNQFAIVLQEPVLFSTSIGENIAYARPDASEADIIAAARAANVHEFISRLPEGYATPVGERGMKLSGGERQRISIARAFLKAAPILILDEPTSAVDVKTEGAIVEAMERLTRGCTTFIITHRPSALRHCDLVLNMELGHAAALEPGPVVAETAPRGAGRETVAAEPRNTYA